MKIGIITHYFKSLNYGGNLQAFALTIFLKSLGYDAEQLCFNIFFKRKKEKKSFLIRCFCFAIYKISSAFKNIYSCNKQAAIASDLEKRKLCIFNFNKNCIPHSTNEYDLNNISEANNFYESFITGSDQVWHPNNFCSAYLLNFVSSKKKKISYAASIAKANLTNEELQTLTSNIASFNAISVRENDSAKILNEKCYQNVFCAVDPIFLLSTTQWDDIAKPYLIKSPYLLTYFLGDNIHARTLAKEFARKHNLLLVVMPYLNGSFRKCDWKYGDKQIFDVGPEHFISLIKNASYIFTDSFHASAFSLLYKKELFVFPRLENKSGDMSNRIVSLLELFNCEKLFCNNTLKTNIDYIESISINSYWNTEKIEKQINNSKTFLLNALNS